MGNCQDAQINQENPQDNLNINDGNNNNNLKQKKQSNNDNSLIVTGITWAKDSHGLFDYETSNTIKTQLKIRESGRIIRKDNMILFQKEDQVQNEDEEILLTLQQDEQGLFWINQHQSGDDSFNQWTVVKDIPSENGYMLRQGDMLKLGRVKFKIKEVALDGDWKKREHIFQQNDKKQTFQLENDNTEAVTEFEYQQTMQDNQNSQQQQGNRIRQQFKQQASQDDLQNNITEANNNNNNNQNNINNNTTINNNSFNILNPDSQNALGNYSNYNNNSIIKQNQQLQQQNKMCRICLSDEQCAESILINPCKCQGTMKYVHLNCLLTWIHSKNQNQINNNNNQNNNNNNNNKQNQAKIIFLTKNFECELCKSKYPIKFQSDGTWYDLYELSRPEGQPFLGLEIMQTTHNRSFSGYYILQFKKGQQQKFNIGRSHQSELRISDISVSREHASLYWNGENIYVQDKQSKFGSLVEVKQEIQLTNDLDGFSIQCGRTTVQFNFKNTNTGCQLFKSCLNQVQTTQSDDDSVENR